MFLCLECLPTVGEIQYCVFCWIMVYMLCISVIQWSWFSVYFGFMNVCPLVFKLLNQKTLKTLENPILFYCDYWYCDGLFFCSLRTISGTNIFGTITEERSWKPIFPGILIISLVLRGEHWKRVDWLLPKRPIFFLLLKLPIFVKKNRFQEIKN